MSTKTENQPEAQEQTIEHKLKQLNEAKALLDEIGGRLEWALSFSKYESINDILEPVSGEAYRAQEEIEEEIQRIENFIESYELDKALALKEVEENHNISQFLG